MRSSPESATKRLPRARPISVSPALPRQLDAPGGEARARDQDRNAHPHGLDHHLGGQAAGGVEDLVAAALAVAEHPAGDLVDGVVAADVLHVDERPVLAGQHAAVDGAGLEIERGRGVDRVGQPIEPGGLERRLRQRDACRTPPSGRRRRCPARSRRSGCASSACPRNWCGRSVRTTTTARSSS